MPIPSEFDSRSMFPFAGLYKPPLVPLSGASGEFDYKIIPLISISGVMGGHSSRAEYYRLVIRKIWYDPNTYCELMMVCTIVVSRDVCNRHCI